MERAGRLDPGTDWDELSIVLMDDRQIARLNGVCLGDSSPTDVLSFRYTLPGRGAAGEIVLNIERAFEEGMRRSGACSELALYLAHGCDHLAGADDACAADRRRMRARELRWLRRIGAELDLAGLLSEK